MSAVLLDGRLALVASSSLPLFLQRFLMMRTTMVTLMMMVMRTIVLARPVMMRCLLDVLTSLSLVTKKGSSFEMRVVILIGGGLV